jgi:hypothetical protein
MAKPADHRSAWNGVNISIVTAAAARTLFVCPDLGGKEGLWRLRTLMPASFSAGEIFEYGGRYHVHYLARSFRANVPSLFEISFG